MIGTRLGSYEIVEQIGRGGMGDVYRATALDTGRPVAIKALRPERVAADPGVVARFRREGEALRRLNHPNIVQMLAAMEVETASGEAAH